MSDVKLEVCSCCGIKEAYIKEGVERIRAEHGDKVKIVEQKCLDICAEFGAVKLGDKIMTLRPEDVANLEAEVRQAVAKQG